jgi:hypothetical protein
MPPATEMYNNRLPHFIVRRYCLGGAAFPSDSGEGGAKDWYLWVCIDRRMDIWPFLLKFALTREVCNGRIEGKDEMAEGFLNNGFAFAFMKREQRPVTRRSIVRYS